VASCGHKSHCQSQKRQSSEFQGISHVLHSNSLRCCLKKSSLQQPSTASASQYSSLFVRPSACTARKVD
jgi:hypothetical protein